MKHFDDERNQGEVQSFDESTPLGREIQELNRRKKKIEELRFPLPKNTRIFTVSNQKGGVGKTTTVVNLAVCLAQGGANVLVVDLDPQGNASTALDVEHREGTPGVYEVMIEDVPIEDILQQSKESERLHILPASIDLAGAEIELVSVVAREQRLSKALEKYLSRNQADYVFIDCPPSLGLLTINAFVAATEVLIPIQCEYYALEGLGQLLKNVLLIEKHLNPELQVSTILLTMFDSRTNLSLQVANEVRSHFPHQTLDAVIPRSVRIAEAPSYSKSVLSYDKNSPGAISYLEAAAEIADKGEHT